MDEFTRTVCFVTLDLEAWDERKTEQPPRAGGGGGPAACNNNGDISLAGGTGAAGLVGFTWTYLADLT